MTELLVHCDSFGTRILDGRTSLRVESGPLRSWTEGIDLCPGCASRLRDQLDASISPAPGEIETGPEVPARHFVSIMSPE